MNYKQLQSEKTKKYTELMNKTGVFFAFGQDQFNEAKKKYPLSPNEKYISIGAGGYIRESNYQEWIEGLKLISKWAKEENAKIRANKKEAEKTILYELNNYEAFYTGEIEDAFEVLKLQGYTRQEVKEVYKKNYNLYA